MSRHPLFGDPRFEQDILPDATWGICTSHAGAVRLVGDDGQPKVGGLCQYCYQEMHSDQFFTCEEHGIQPKGPHGGCPFDGCLGTRPQPTAEEIAREAESLSRVWPGGPPILKDVVDAKAARSADERDRGVGERFRAIASGVLRVDPESPAPDEAPGHRSEKWQDPFLIDE